MSATARVTTSGNVFQGQLSQISLTKMWLLVLCLSVGVLISAMSLVYTRDLGRRVFGQMQTEAGLHDRLQVQWSQLLLEQSTWGAQVRVREIAQDKLGMHLPKQEQVIVLEQ